MRKDPHLRDRRRPPRRYKRGEETRRRIVESALELFGDLGFEGATTRQIAQRARVNLPALRYYFGGKQGLYLACADHIAQTLEARFSALGAIEQALQTGSRARGESVALLRNALEAFADRLIEAPPTDNWILFMTRELARPTQAFDIVFDRVLARVFALCRTLVAEAIGQTRDDDVVRLRTLIILGQTILFIRAREAALRLLGWPDFGGERLALVKKTLWRHAEAALMGGARGGDNP